MIALRQQLKKHINNNFFFRKNMLRYASYYYLLPLLITFIYPTVTVKSDKKCNWILFIYGYRDLPSSIDWQEKIIWWWRWRHKLRVMLCCWRIDEMTILLTHYSLWYECFEWTLFQIAGQPISLLWCCCNISIHDEDWSEDIHFNLVTKLFFILP